MLHVVLVEPEIPANTGNIARTCAATGSVLHLIRPLGFDISDKAVKRAGLDYWHLVDVRDYENLDDFFSKNDVKTINPYAGWNIVKSASPHCMYLCASAYSDFCSFSFQRVEWKTHRRRRPEHQSRHADALSSVHSPGADSEAPRARGLQLRRL